MEILFRKANSSGLFQWSVNGKRWYPIRYDNVLVDDEMRNRAEIMNKALQGETLRLSGCYVKSTKVLAISQIQGD
jgi:hypothetical protein